MINLHVSLNVGSESVHLWRRHRPIIVGILTALALANASTDSAANAIGAQSSGIAASEAKAPGVVSRGALTANTALRCIFGEIVYKDGFSFGRWTEARFPKTDEFKYLEGRNTLLVSSLGIFPIQEDGETRQVIIFQSVPDDPNFSCHGCGVIIGAAVFRPIDGGWQVVRETRAITVAGANGQAPEGKPIMLGPAQWGLLFKGDYSGMGTCLRYAFIIDQNEQGFYNCSPVFDMGEDNNNICNAMDEDVSNPPPCYSYDATLRANPTIINGRYLLGLETKGTRPNERGGVDYVIEAQQFRFQNGQYIEIPGKHVVSRQPR